MLLIRCAGIPECGYSVLGTFCKENSSAKTSVFCCRCHNAPHVAVLTTKILLSRIGTQVKWRVGTTHCQLAEEQGCHPGADRFPGGGRKKVSPVAGPVRGHSSKTHRSPNSISVDPFFSRTPPVHHKSYNSRPSFLVSFIFRVLFLLCKHHLHIFQKIANPKSRHNGPEKSSNTWRHLHPFRRP